jgi:hypothetical protein
MPHHPNGLRPKLFLTKYENFRGRSVPDQRLKAICLLLDPSKGMFCPMKTPKRVRAICIIGIIS